jgi:hypothetical protein
MGFHYAHPSWADYLGWQKHSSYIQLLNAEIEVGEVEIKVNEMESYVASNKQQRTRP